MDIGKRKFQVNFGPFWILCHKFSLFLVFTWPNFAVVYQNWQISGILVLSIDLYLDLLRVKMICTANQLNCLMFLKGCEMLVIVKRTCYTKSIDCCLSQKQRSLYLPLFACKQLFSDKSSQVTQLDLSILHFWKANIYDQSSVALLKKEETLFKRTISSAGFYELAIWDRCTLSFWYLLKLDERVAGQFFSAGVIELTHFSPTVFLTARKTDPLKIPP